jgi:hypothetical protein
MVTLNLLLLISIFPKHKTKEARENYTFDKSTSNISLEKFLPSFFYMFSNSCTEQRKRIGYISRDKISKSMNPYTYQFDHSGFRDRGTHPFPAGGKESELGNMDGLLVTPVPMCNSGLEATKKLETPYSIPHKREPPGGYEPPGGCCHLNPRILGSLNPIISSTPSASWP